MSAQQPNIIIVGRPNVGKSTLVNRIIGKRKAITLDVPGVTRDILSFPTSWDGTHFMVSDTGGVFFENDQKGSMQLKVEALVKNALDQADIIVFLTDQKTGLMGPDQTIAEVLRPLSDKVILAVNKVDNAKRGQDTADFFRLGFGEPILLSAIQGSGVDSLMSHIVSGLQKNGGKQGKESESGIAFSFVGRPNVGKSSLINELLKETRLLVQDEAGTTRDAITVPLRWNNQQFNLIDTAGLRRRSKVNDSIEYYSTVRSSKAIEESDVVVFVTEPESILSDQDKKIVGQIQKAGKPMVLFINKWDLTERTDQARSDMKRIISSEMPGLDHFPVVFGSALLSKDVFKLFDIVLSLYQKTQERIPTSQLNAFVDKIIKSNPPPQKYGKRVSIYYATQVEQSPAVFIFFVNNPKWVDRSYKRFLENRLRDRFTELEGLQVQIWFRAR